MDSRRNVLFSTILHILLQFLLLVHLFSFKVLDTFSLFRASLTVCSAVKIILFLLLLLFTSNWFQILSFFLYFHHFRSNFRKYFSPRKAFFLNFKQFFNHPLNFNKNCTNSIDFSNNFYNFFNKNLLTNSLFANLESFLIRHK